MNVGQRFLQHAEQEYFGVGLQSIRQVHRNVDFNSATTGKFLNVVCGCRRKTNFVVGMENTNGLSQQSSRTWTICELILRLRFHWQNWRSQKKEFAPR
jgi:hypothetical protein